MHHAIREVFALRKDVRVWFSKTGTARYISHLDLNRCMSRAFHRAKLPLWYTEGFNPHVFLTFAAPLSLGFESRNESMDIRLIEDMPYDELIEKLNLGLPHDIRVWAVTEPEMKANDIANAAYIMRLETDDMEAALADIRSVLAQPELIVEKHSKKGLKTIDIKPNFENMQIEQGDGELIMTVCLPAGNQGGVNPTLFVDAAEKLLNRELLVRIERTKLFDANMREFK